MRGNQRVIELLNELLTLELTAINQYFAHTKMIENQGYVALAATVRKQALDEMKDAEEIMDRILFLEGIPNLQRLGPVLLGETVAEQLRLMLDTERSVLSFLTGAVAACEQENDTASREFFAGRFAEEEEHVDFLETQLELIERLGEANYLSQQIRD